MRYARHVTRMGDRKNAYRILVEDPEGKRPLVTTRRTWVNDIKMELEEREKELSGMDWIDLTQDCDQRRTLVNTVMSLRVPKNIGSFLFSWAAGRFSRTQLHGVSNSRFLRK
jgi:hypothetical protein